MSEPPTLEYGGRRYRRQGGSWLEGQLRVPQALAQRLDSIAKRDAEFWGTCEAQDAADAPRKQDTRIRKLIVALFSGDVPRELQRLVEPKPVKGQSSRQTSRQRQFGLTCEFKRDGRLVIGLDLAQAWRQTEKAWCARASETVNLPFDLRLTIAVEVVESLWGQWDRRRPSHAVEARHLDRDWRSFDSAHPVFVSTDAIHQGIRRRLDEARCTFVVPFFDQRGSVNVDLPWLESDAGESVRFEYVDYGVYEKTIRLSDNQYVSRPFKIGLACRLRQGRRPQRATEYEYDTPMASAGLPSLGKRR